MSPEPSAAVEKSWYLFAIAAAAPSVTITEFIDFLQALVKVQASPPGMTRGLYIRMCTFRMAFGKYNA